MAIVKVTWILARGALRLFAQPHWPPALYNCQQHSIIAICQRESGGLADVLACDYRACNGCHGCPEPRRAVFDPLPGQGRGQRHAALLRTACLAVKAQENGG